MYAYMHKRTHKHALLRKHLYGLNTFIDLTMIWSSDFPEVALWSPGSPGRSCNGVEMVFVAILTVCAFTGHPLLPLQFSGFAWLAVPDHRSPW
jgi:hypothetical protein